MAQRTVINCPDVRLSRFQDIVMESHPGVDVQTMTREEFAEKLDNHVAVLKRKRSQLIETESDYYTYDASLTPPCWVTYFGKTIVHMGMIMELIEGSLRHMLAIPDGLIGWGHPVARRYYNSVLGELLNMERAMGGTAFRVIRPRVRVTRLYDMGAN